MADHRTLPQPQRLHAVMLGAREARLAYQRGEITHEERMARLEALCRPIGAAQELRGMLMRCRSSLRIKLNQLMER